MKYFIKQKDSQIFISETYTEKRREFPTHQAADDYRNNHLSAHPSHFEIVSEGEEVKTFTAGQKLSTSSICNSDCIFKGTVVKRTAKMLTLKIYDEEKRLKIHSDEEGEFIFPLGQYSMSPTFRA